MLYGVSARNRGARPLMRLLDRTIDVRSTLSYYAQLDSTLIGLLRQTHLPAQRYETRVALN